MASNKPKMAFKAREYDGHRVLWPADTFTREWMASQSLEGLHWVSTHRPRSPQFHRAVHKLCTFLAHHCQKFEGMDAHALLKRLQLESRLYCDSTMLTIPGFGEVMHLIPKSIAFDNMDETEFREFYKAIADHVAKTHWPEFSLELLNQKDTQI